MKAQVQTYSGWNGETWIQASFQWSDSLETAKESLKTLTNTQAYTYLQPSDWLVVRQTETGVDAPEVWTTWRQEIRDCAIQKNQEISLCSSKEELAEYTASDQYLEWPDSP
jgi:hypothetical protein